MSIKSSSFQISALQILICIIGVILITPFFQLSLHNVPGASDDLFHGFHMVEENYWEAVRLWYIKGYNGRFANALFMLLPGRPFLGFNFGAFYPIVSFIVLYTSILSFIKACFSNNNIKEHIVFTTVLFTFLLAYMPELQEFYWYSGYTVYTLPAIFFFFLMNLLIRKFNTKYKIWELIVLSILLLLIIGSQENWMIACVLTVYYFVLNKLLNKEKLTTQTKFIIVWTTLLFCFALFAPGVTHRVKAETEVAANLSFFDAFNFSFLYTGEYVSKWFFSSGLFLVGLCVMLNVKPNEINSLKTPLPLFSSTLLFLLVVYSGFFILIYSLGLCLPWRVRGVIPNFFVCTIAIFHVFYFLGHTQIAQSLRVLVSTKGRYLILFIAMVTIMVNSSNYKDICYDLSSGNAEKQAIDTRWLINLIKDCKEPELIIPQQTTTCNALYPLKFPTQKDGFDSWLVREYFKVHVVADEKLPIEDFKKTHYVSNGYLQSMFYKDFPWGVGNTTIFQSHEVSNKDLYLSFETTNKVIPEKATVNIEHPDFTEVINVKQNTAEKTFNYKVEFPQLINGQQLKIYLLNNIDTLTIHSFKKRVEIR